MVTNFPTIRECRIGKKAYSCLSLLFLLAHFSSFAAAPNEVLDDEQDSTTQDISRSKVDCCILKTVTAINQKLACNSAISFGSAEINRPGGYVITEPGIYCLKEDVVFSPRLSTIAPVTPTPPYDPLAATTVQAAITIRSSNVVLDLGDHTLKQANSVAQTTIADGSIGATLPATTINVTSTVGFPTSGTVNVFALQANGSVVPQVITYDGLTATSFLNTTGGTGTLQANGIVQVSTQVPYVVGIVVPDMIPNNPDINAVGLQSIYIKGGDPAIIQDFSMLGVCIFAHTFDIRLSNLTIKNCGQMASRALRPTVYGHEYIPHAAVTTGFGPSFGVGGLRIGESTALGMGPVFFADVPIVPGVLNNVNRIRQVILENVSCLENWFIGMISPCITDYTINNCHIDGTQSDDPGRATAPAYNAPSIYGAVFSVGGGSATIEPNGNIDPSCVNMVVSDTTFNNTVLRGDYTNAQVGGFFMPGGVADTRSRNVSWNNCQFNGTSNTFLTSGAVQITIGYVSGGVEDYTFNNCNFDDISSLGRTQAMHISGTTANQPTKSARNVKFKDCTARNIQSNRNLQLPAPIVTTSVAKGFACFFIKNLVFENCIASDIICNSPVSSTSFQTGFQVVTSFSGTDDGQTENQVLKNCVTERVRANSGGHVFGFYSSVSVLTADHSGAVVYEDCVSTGNRATTSLFPVWSSTTNYAVGSLISYLGVNYRSLIANNIGNQPNTNPAAWSTTTNIAQATASGFVVDDSGVASINAPEVFRNCIASRNKGAAFALLGAGAYYSAGLFINLASRVNLDSCIATDNVYGILLNGSERCTIRNCQSDNNVEAGVGGGYVDTGFAGTGNPVTPTQSNSVWESNRAFNNGALTTHVGFNNNYDIWMDAALSLRPPLLRGQLSTGIYTATDPGTYFASLHNNSVIL